MRAPTLAVVGAMIVMLVVLPSSPALAGTGGSGYSPTRTSKAPGKAVVAGNRAKLLANGLAAAPANAPKSVQRMVWAANKLQDKPYLYGGGHGVFPVDRGYDCSGTVSYALYYGGILDGEPRDSVGFFTWGTAGKGRWVTVYANGGHSFMEIAGLRLDTSRAGDPSGGSGPRWRRTLRDTSSFRARSWPGL